MIEAQWAKGEGAGISGAAAQGGEGGGGVGGGVGGEEAGEAGGEAGGEVGGVYRTVGWDDTGVELFSVGPGLVGEEELLTKRKFMKS